jgi:hypothetical protein
MRAVGVHSPDVPLPAHHRVENNVTAISAGRWIPIVVHVWCKQFQGSAVVIDRIEITLLIHENNCLLRTDRNASDRIPARSNLPCMGGIVPAYNP